MELSKIVWSLVTNLPVLRPLLISICSRSSRGLVKQYNQELCISSYLIRCFRACIIDGGETLNEENNTWKSMHIPAR